MKILSILLALIYALFPYDLLPDFLVGWGWLDDIFLLGMLWYYLSRRKGLKPSARQWFGGQGRTDNTRGDPGRSDDASGRREQRNLDPYTVLGVSPHATEDEIKSAYRRLVRQYHPDKVAHLGEEFKQMAEKRFKEIQQAYQQIMPSK